MGKSNSEQVPIKYKNSSMEVDYQTYANFAMLFSFFALIYRQQHKVVPKAKGKGKAAANKSQGFGGGFMNNMMNQQKQVKVEIYGVDKKIKTKFRHVAGNENAKKEVMEFVDFLKDPSKYKKLGAKVPRGAMMVGPPGTGKTLLAKAVAGEAGVPFLTVSGSDFVEMYVGLGASRVRDLFKKAKEHDKAIIFIDEIDAVGKKRHGKMGGNDESDNTLNQLLVEMDGFTTDENIIILAATNNAEILDNALTRPGRFDRTIQVTLPSIEERKQIYNVHLKKIKLNNELTREEYAAKLSTLTPGFSGADIANICNEAAIISARNDLSNVSIKQFELATERVIAGLERKNIMSPQERKTVAYHEAGHAVAGWFLEHSSPLLKVTIIPRSKGSLGYAQYLPEEVSLYTTEQLMDQVKVALGGRVAEEIFFNKITTGASDDIKKVTQIVQGLVKVYGMNDKIGLRSYQDDPNDFISVKPYSDYTNEMIDDECQNIVKDMYEQTRQLLESKRDLIDNLAEKLLEKETVNLTDLVDVLGDRPYGINDSMKEYLKEMRTREEIEKQEKEEAEQKDASNDEDGKEEESDDKQTEDKEGGEKKTDDQNNNDKSSDASK